MFVTGSTPSRFEVHLFWMLEERRKIHRKRQSRDALLPGETFAEARSVLALIATDVIDSIPRGMLPDTLPSR